MTPKPSRIHTRITTTLATVTLVTVTAGGAMLLTAGAHGEEIEVPVGQQAADKQAIRRPATGTNSETVRQTYGEPLDWRQPVGDPPISRWEYENFVVYFEYDHVIHTVLKYNNETAAAGQ